MNSFIMKIGLLGVQQVFGAQVSVWRSFQLSNKAISSTFAIVCTLESMIWEASVNNHSHPEFVTLRNTLNKRPSQIDFIASNEIRKFRDFSTSFLLLSLIIRLEKQKMHSMQLRCYQRWIAKLCAATNSIGCVNSLLQKKKERDVQ